jgi:limonene 1,2-monooxygenase
MFGVGPGALTSDAYMMGIDALTQRQKMDEALGVIIRLFKGEVVNMETDWFVLREGRLQLAPYSYPHMPIAVASTFSPAGPTTAGKYGVGVLSVAASQPGGLISLPNTWQMAEETASKNGQTVNREEWRLVMPMYVAESRQEAYDDVRELMPAFQTEYFEGTLGRPVDPSISNDVEAQVERGGAIIGTPDDAIEAIERIFEMSGGFGGMLALAHEWAPREKIWHSFELIARYVAPRFQNQLWTEGNQQFVAAHKDTIFGPNAFAIGKAFVDAGVPLPDLLVQRASRGNT